MTDSIEQDLKIDLLDLANEAARQPDLYHKWANRYAEAHSMKVKVRELSKVEKIRIKQAFDEVKANLEIQVRENWDQYSSERISDAKIASTVTGLPEFKKGQETYLNSLSLLNQQIVDATHEDLILEAARDAMLQRHQSIKIAGELYLGGYFSDVSFNRPGIANMKEEVIKNVQKELKSKLKKRG